MLKWHDVQVENCIAFSADSANVIIERNEFSAVPKGAQESLWLWFARVSKLMLQLLVMPHSNVKYEWRI